MKREDLLERLRANFPGEDNANFNALDLIHKFGTPLTALLYSELFWPEFREVQGMVFLADNIEDHEDEAKVKALLDKCGDPSEVEQAFNFVEVPLLFGGAAGEGTDEDAALLAERLREMWSARLKVCFPRRTFWVEVLPLDEGTEVAVRFFEDRSKIAGEE